MTSSPMLLPTALIPARWVRYLPFRAVRVSLREAEFYTEPARRQRDENQIDAIDKDPLTKCYMPGVPRANYLPFPFQIVQSTDVI